MLPALIRIQARLYRKIMNDDKNLPYLEGFFCNWIIFCHYLIIKKESEKENEKVF